MYRYARRINRYAGSVTFRIVSRCHSIVRRISSCATKPSMPNGISAVLSREVSTLMQGDCPLGVGFDSSAGKNAVQGVGVK
jgi:hypothetical protein